MVDPTLRGCHGARLNASSPAHEDRQARLFSLNCLSLASDLKFFYTRLRRRMQDASATSGLSAPQASVLARLEKAGPSSASVLAGAERVRAQSMGAPGAQATRDEWLARALEERFSDAERATIAAALRLLDRLVQP